MQTRTGKTTKQTRITKKNREELQKNVNNLKPTLCVQIDITPGEKSDKLGEVNNSIYHETTVSGSNLSIPKAEIMRFSSTIDRFLNRDRPSSTPLISSRFRSNSTNTIGLLSDQMTPVQIKGLFLFVVIIIFSVFMCYDC